MKTDGRRVESLYVPYPSSTIRRRRLVSYDCPVALVGTSSPQNTSSLSPEGRLGHDGGG